MLNCETNLDKEGETSEDVVLLSDSEAKGKKKKCNTNVLSYFGSTKACPSANHAPGFIETGTKRKKQTKEHFCIKCFKTISRGNADAKSRHATTWHKDNKTYDYTLFFYKKVFYKKVLVTW